MEELLRTVRFVFTLEFWRMAVCWPLSLIPSYFPQFSGALIGQRKSKSYSRSESHFFTSATAGAQRPICIVTGATSGLGAATAHALSREGFFVVLVGRSNHLLSKTVEEITKGNENAQLKAFKADMSSFSSILKFKASFEQWLVDMDMDMDRSVQLLINNAGILATTYRSTADGLDEMMATNYVGAFCLTNLLMPLLMSSRIPARVVNVSSFTHRNGEDVTSCMPNSMVAVLSRTSFVGSSRSSCQSLDFSEFIMGCFSE